MSSPTRTFFIHRVSGHTECLQPFDLSHRNADTATYNCVSVPNILSSSYHKISVPADVKKISAGDATFVVMPQHTISEPLHLIIVLLETANRKHDGYFSEHHPHEETTKKFATLDIELNLNTPCDEHKDYRMFKKVVKH